MQFPSFELLVRDARFDPVHHQHLNYFSLNSVSILLAKSGMSVVFYRYDSDHYGALMCRIKKSYTIPFSNTVRFSLWDLNAARQVFMQLINAAERRIAAFKDDLYYFGASLTLPILGYSMASMHPTCTILDGRSVKDGLTYVNFLAPGSQ